MSDILSKMPRTLAGLAIVAAAGGIMAAAPASSSTSSASVNTSLETPSAFADR